MAVVTIWGPTRSGQATHVGVKIACPPGSSHGPAVEIRPVPCLESLTQDLGKRPYLSSRCHLRRAVSLFVAMMQARSQTAPSVPKSKETCVYVMHSAAKRKTQELRRTAQTGVFFRASLSRRTPCPCPSALVPCGLFCRSSRTQTPPEAQHTDAAMQEHAHTLSHPQQLLHHGFVCVWGLQSATHRAPCSSFSAQWTFFPPSMTDESLSFARRRRRTS